MKICSCRKEMIGECVRVCVRGGGGGGGGMHM